ncbi:MAG: hypothetical protein JKY71_06930 [Alphaproteobacteria bacterium]|nr:hypothetical protein [Alphaproteobacteria bacterium]
MNTIKNTVTNLRAWVVFSGQADLPWLKILKPGFRHCAVLLNDGERWITIDPLSNYTDVNVHHVATDFDLPRWMCGRGHIVVPAEVSRSETPAPLGLFSCVEAVKRVLGIHDRLILTPWQLYRHLTTTKEIPTLKGDFAWEV